MRLLSQRTTLKTWISLAALLFCVACGTEDDSASAPNSGGTGGVTGAAGAGHGGDASQLGAHLVAGGVTMASGKYRLVGSMASGNHTPSASKNYELHGGILSGDR